MMSKFISLKTDLPGPKSKKIAQRREKYVAKPMGSSLSPCYIEKGEGALVTDVDGNQFIDLTGGWGCLAVGHSHKKVVAAIQDQARKIPAYCILPPYPIEFFGDISKKN